MGGEHSAGQQVGLTHVVEEAAHVAVETGVDAVEVLRLVEREIERDRDDSDESSLPSVPPSFLFSLHP